MSSKFPIVKKIDRLGRILICSDIRKMYGFDTDKEVLIYLKEDGFFVKPMPQEDNQSIIT